MSGKLNINLAQGGDSLTDFFFTWITRENVKVQSDFMSYDHSIPLSRTNLPL
jgi:hypothetical protein